MKRSRAFLARSFAAALLGFAWVGCAESVPGYEPPPDAGDTIDGSSTDVPDDTVEVSPPPLPDSGPACTRDDDCSCTRGEVCRMNRCVVRAGEMPCGDTIACTDDRCDAATDRCVHEPNDTRCPSGLFCDRSPIAGGCVREVSCELGDMSCARLQGDACTGTWSCDPARLRCVRSAPYNCDDMDTCTTDACRVSGTAPLCSHQGPNYQSDVMNCGRCGNRCAPAAHQNAMCVMGACRFACETPWVDRNGVAMDGCECNAEALDVPDLMFRDTNCDGIDGTVANAIFVSPRGDDRNDGTGTLTRDANGRVTLTVRPKRTLQAAITVAGSLSPRRAVYAATGAYTGTVQLVGGVSLYGGYDDARGWSRARENVSTIEGDTIGVQALRLTQSTEVQHFTITSRDATVPGESSYGVLALNGVAELALRGCTIRTGHGANGTHGPSGFPGAVGGNGNPGAMTAGGGGASSCEARGGNGGAGAGSNQSGHRGGDGVVAPGGGCAGSGGRGGAGNRGACPFPAQGGESAPSPPVLDGATAGCNGATGRNAGSAALRGRVDTVSGRYVPPVAPNGTAGAAGGGGGGGGGGGSGNQNTGWLSCVSVDSGGGGGGGGGGCGGGGGSGGSGGGGSFAVMSVASVVTLEGCSLHAGRGGNGGNGGNGADGGRGGVGGAGAPPAGGAAGRGGDGASGGRGGAGGNGTGGTGGPSACVGYVGRVPVGTHDCGLNSGGSPGQGGQNTSVGRAPDGHVGATSDTLDLS